MVNRSSRFLLGKKKEDDPSARRLGTMLPTSAPQVRPKKDSGTRFFEGPFTQERGKPVTAVDILKAGARFAYGAVSRDIEKKATMFQEGYEQLVHPLIPIPLAAMEFVEWRTPYSDTGRPGDINREEITSEAAKYSPQMAQDLALGQMFQFPSENLHQAKERAVAYLKRTGRGPTDEQMKDMSFGELLIAETAVESVLLAAVQPAKWLLLGAKSAWKGRKGIAAFTKTQKDKLIHKLNVQRRTAAEVIPLDEDSVELSYKFADDMYNDLWDLNNNGFETVINPRKFDSPQDFNINIVSDTPGQDTDAIIRAAEKAGFSARGRTDMDGVITIRANKFMSGNHAADVVRQLDIDLGILDEAGNPTDMNLDELISFLSRKDERFKRAITTEGGWALKSEDEIRDALEIFKTELDIKPSTPLVDWYKEIGPSFQKLPRGYGNISPTSPYGDGRFGDLPSLEELEDVVNPITTRTGKPSMDKRHRLGNSSDYVNPPEPHWESKSRQFFQPEPRRFKTSGEYLIDEPNFLQTVERYEQTPMRGWPEKGAGPLHKVMRSIEEILEAGGYQGVPQTPFEEASGSINRSLHQVDKEIRLAKTKIQMGKDDLKQIDMLLDEKEFTDFSFSNITEDLANRIEDTEDWMLFSAGTKQPLADEYTGLPRAFFNDDFEWRREVLKVVGDQINNGVVKAGDDLNFWESEFFFKDLIENERWQAAWFAGKKRIGLYKSRAMAHSTIGVKEKAARAQARVMMSKTVGGRKLLDGIDVKEIDDVFSGGRLGVTKKMRLPLKVRTFYEDLMITKGLGTGGMRSIENLNPYEMDFLAAAHGWSDEIRLAARAINEGPSPHEFDELMALVTGPRRHIQGKRGGLVDFFETRTGKKPKGKTKTVESRIRQQKAHVGLTNEQEYLEVLQDWHHYVLSRTGISPDDMLKFRRWEMEGLNEWQHYVGEVINNMTVTELEKTTNGILSISPEIAHGMGLSWPGLKEGFSPDLIREWTRLQEGPYDASYGFEFTTPGQKRWPGVKEEDAARVNEIAMRMESTEKMWPASSVQGIIQRWDLLDLVTTDPKSQALLIKKLKREFGDKIMVFRGQTPAELADEAIEEGVAVYAQMGWEASEGVPFAGYTLNPNVAFMQGLNAENPADSLIQVIMVNTEDLVFLGDPRLAEVIKPTKAGEEYYGWTTLSMVGPTAYAAKHQVQDPSARRLGTMTNDRDENYSGG